MEALNPAVRGEVEGALFCERDAVVEPGAVLPAIHTHLQSRGGYEFLAGRNVVDVDGSGLIDHTGERHHADLVVLATGDAYNGIAADHFAGSALRRCRLQMCQTAPFPAQLTTSIADGDSLRYYPAYRLPALDALAPPAEIVQRHHMQLLLVQRANGELTIGDTHAYDEPFDFAVDEDPYAYLAGARGTHPGHAAAARAAAVGGRVLTGDRRTGRPPRASWPTNVTVVTGLGGRGMTLSPAVAEETFTELGRDGAGA